MRLRLRLVALFLGGLLLFGFMYAPRASAVGYWDAVEIDFIWLAEEYSGCWDVVLWWCDSAPDFYTYVEIYQNGFEKSFTSYNKPNDDAFAPGWLVFLKLWGDGSAVTVNIWIYDEDDPYADQIADVKTHLVCSQRVGGFAYLPGTGVKYFQMSGQGDESWCGDDYDVYLDMRVDTVNCLQQSCTDQKAP